MSHHSNAFSRVCVHPEGISSLRSVKLPFLTISSSATTREKAKGDIVSSDRSLMLGGRSHFSFDAPSSEAKWRFLASDESENTCLPNPKCQITPPQGFLSGQSAQVGCLLATCLPGP